MQRINVWLAGIWSWSEKEPVSSTRVLMFLGLICQIMAVTRVSDGVLMIPASVWLCFGPFLYALLLNTDHDYWAARNIAIFSLSLLLISNGFSLFLPMQIAHGIIWWSPLVIFILSERMHALLNWRGGYEHVPAWGKDRLRQLFMLITFVFNSFFDLILKAVKPKHFSAEDDRQLERRDPPFKWMRWF